MTSDPDALVVTYADIYGGYQNHYALVDKYTREIIMQDRSKSAVIAEAQRRKGWKPIDGDERTYGKQTVEHSRIREVR